MIQQLAHIERELIGEAWVSEHIYTNLETLCDFGPRFGGTPAEQQARDFIREGFASYGLDNVHLEGFEYTAWRRGDCSMRVTQPVQRELSAISLVYSPSTPPEGLHSEVIDLGVGTEADFEAHEDEIPGRIVLTTSANPEGGPWVHRREKYGRAVNYGAAGFVFMNHLPGLLAPTGSLRPGRLGQIPGVGISYEEGFYLQRWCARGRVVAELHLQNESGTTLAHHVVGDVPGSPGDEIVIAGAHYDSHDISPGAMDDGAGTALLMELARLFAPLAGRFLRTIRFVAFAVEELGVLGSTEYVRAHADETRDWALMVNLDSGVGPGPHGFAISGFTELRPVLAEFSRDMRHPLTISNRIATAADSFPFFMAGVPAISLEGGKYDIRAGRGYGHTAADTLDKVEEVDLKASAAVMARVLLRLVSYEGELGRHRSQGEIRQMLIDQDLERPLRAQDKWPF
ncbi:MAG: M28 family peptidase [Anaerolineae bacterium]